MGRLVDDKLKDARPMKSRTAAAALILVGLTVLALWRFTHLRDQPISTDPSTVSRKQARDLWSEALERRARGEDPDEAERLFGEALDLARLIETYYQDPSLREACQYYASFTRARAEKKRQADERYQQALAGYRAGKRDRARELLLEARESYRTLDDEWGELAAMHLLGNVEWVSGHLDEARDIYIEILPKARRLQDLERESAALNNLSKLEEGRGNFREASAGYRRVHALGEAHGLARITGFALLYQGNLYHRLGLYERSISAFEDAEATFRAMDDRSMEAAVASNRGASLHRSGDHDGALAAYRQSLELRSRLGDRAGRIRTLLHVAELNYESGELERAARELEEILKLTETSDDSSARDFRWGALITTADIHLDLGRVALARQAIDEAESLTQDGRRALDGVENSRRRARLLLEEGRPKAAAAELRRAVARIEDLRANPEGEEARIRFLETQASVFKDLAGIYLRRLNDPLAAFELLERSRSRAFLDSLEGGVFLSSEDSAAPRVLLSSSAETESVDRVVSRLPAGSVLLHYTVAPRWLAVLVFDSGGLCSWKVHDIDRAELEGVARDFVEQTAGTGSISGTAGAVLSRLLLEPAEELLAATDMLIVVPDRSLFAIPWGALPWRASYLVEEREITIEPSASVFVRLADRAPRPETTSALVVANPLFYLGREVAGEDGANTRDSSAIIFRPLPEAEQEAKEVSALLQPSLLLVGERASEPRVRAEIGRHDIVHFGTHARIVPDQPLASSLLLAGGGRTLADSQLEPVSPADGVLTGYEVLGLELKPQALVTLAACESVGKGRREGEGLVGLARAFFEAGAGTVVASLWPVEDRATRELMVRFYRELSAGKKSTARALATAQTAMARGDAGENQKHPFHWARFVLIGDGR